MLDVYSKTDLLIVSLMLSPFHVGMYAFIITISELVYQISVLVRSNVISKAMNFLKNSGGLARAVVNKAKHVFFCYHRLVHAVVLCLCY